MKLTTNTNRMTEEEAEVEVKRRNTYWLTRDCPIWKSICYVGCISYNEAFKKHLHQVYVDGKQWQVKDGYCSCVLVTGTIEHEGCECGG